MQFYLDMEFVILFASQGRYLSRNLQQVIKNIIGRAIEAVAESKIDPYRYTTKHKTKPRNHNAYMLPSKKKMQA